MSIAEPLVEFDISLVPQCEYSDHAELNSEGPAAYVVKVDACPGCTDPSFVILVCDDCYQANTVFTTNLTCHGCGYSAPVSEWWTIVQKL